MSKEGLRFTDELLRRLVGLRILTPAKVEEENRMSRANYFAAMIVFAHAFRFSR